MILFDQQTLSKKTVVLLEFKCRCPRRFSFMQDIVIHQSLSESYLDCRKKPEQVLLSSQKLAHFELGRGKLGVFVLLLDQRAACLSLESLLHASVKGGQPVKGHRNHLNQIYSVLCCITPQELSTLPNQLNSQSHLGINTPLSPGACDSNISPTSKFLLG